MAGGELAVGYISLIPSFKGGAGSIERELSGPAAAAGRSTGKRFGDEFTRSASKSTSGLKTKLAGLAKGVGLVGAAALGTGGLLAGIGIKSAASIEQTRTSFASLLGSVKAANEQISALQKFAAKTPFSQQDVFGYAQQFYSLANSVGLSKDQLFPFLKAVGDLGAVTGASTENIHNAVLAISQIGSRGKVTLDNLNQISQAFPGFNAAAAIASATGQTTAQVMKQIGNGTLDATTGVNALLTGMQKYKGAAGAMAKQSKTLNGLFSTFSDTIKIKLTNAFAPLIPVVKDTLGQMTPVIAKTLDTLAPTIASFVKNLAPVLAPLTEGLGKILGAIFDALGPVLKTLAPVIKPLADAFVLLVNALKPFINFIAQAIAQLLPPLIQMFKIFERAIAPVAKQLFDALAPVLPIIADALKRVAVALQPVITALAGSFSDVIAAIAPSLPGLAQSFGDLAVAVAAMIVPLTPLITLSAKLSAKILPPLLSVIKALTHAVTWWIYHVTIPALKFLLNTFLDVVGGIVHAADDMFGWVPFVGGKLDAAAAAIDRFKEKVNSGFGSVSGPARTAASAMGAAAAAGVAAGGAAAGAATNLSLFKTAAAGIGAIGGPLVGAFNAVTGAIGATTAAIQRMIGIAAAALAALAVTPFGGLLSGAAAALAAASAAIGFSSGGGGGGAPPPPSFDGGGGGGGGKDKKKDKPPKFDRGTLIAFRHALSGDAAGIKAAIHSITKSIRESKHVVPAYVATEGAQLEKMAKHRTEVSKRLDAANTALQNVQAKYNAIFTGVRSAFRGAFDIGSAGTGPSGAARVTTGRIMAQLRQTANRAVAFGSLLKKLAREGLPSGLLSQLAQAGPQALAQAQALAKATPGQLAGIKADFSRLTNAGQQSGKFLADDLYGAGVKSAKGLRDGLRSQKSALTDAIKELGEAMIRQLKRTLKIHSPSRVTHEIGQFLGLGLEHGIASKYGDVSRAADGLANASRPKLASVRGGGSSAVTFSDVDIDRLAAAVASRPVTLVAKGRHLADVVLAETDVLAVQMKTAERSGLARGGVR